jgi:hypothetical protein
VSELRIATRDIDLPYAARTTEYRGQGRAVMFGSKRKRRLEEYETKQAKERYDRAFAAGMEINKRIVELHKMDRSRLQGELRLLLAEAKHQTQIIQRSIVDRTGYSFDGEPEAEGDLFTFYGDVIAGVMRENSADPQTVMQALADKLPDVRFSVHWYDAVAMTAAMFREYRVSCIIEGLEMAGMWDDGR